jgi:hypothetical protein
MKPKKGAIQYSSLKTASVSHDAALVEELRADPELAAE